MEVVEALFQSLILLTKLNHEPLDQIAKCREAAEAQKSFSTVPLQGTLKDKY